MSKKIGTFSPLGDKKEIRLAIVGKVDENDHPYSWSAMFNGYDPEEMAKWADPIILSYLKKEPKETLCIPNAKVTHIWTDNPIEAQHIAKASFIPHVVKNAVDVIGKVDAILIPTDKGHEHVERCHPFVEVGLPIFVDKPLVDNETDLKIFSKWIKQGAPIMSCSFMRYCKEYMPYRASIHELGKIRYASITTPKSWERYGIHPLEGIYTILGTGFISVRNIGTFERNVVHLKHSCGADVIVIATADMFGALGALQLIGTAGHVEVTTTDRYYAFKTQLGEYVKFVRTGVQPFPFAETREIMKLVIAGIRSREQKGREVLLSEIKAN
jgi:hypothetical protein